MDIDEICRKMVIKIDSTVSSLNLCVNCGHLKWVFGVIWNSINLQLNYVWKL